MKVKFTSDYKSANKGDVFESNEHHCKLLISKGLAEQADGKTKETYTENKKARAKKQVEAADKAIKERDNK